MSGDRHGNYVDNPMWYRRVRINGKQVYVHRHITGAKLDEVVHHIDGNIHNNEPSNLKLMSRGEHQRMHVIARYRGE